MGNYVDESRERYEAVKADNKREIRSWKYRINDLTKKTKTWKAVEYGGFGTSVASSLTTLATLCNEYDFGLAENRWMLPLVTIAVAAGGFIVGQIASTQKEKHEGSLDVAYQRYDYLKNKVAEAYNDYLDAKERGLLEGVRDSQEVLADRLFGDSNGDDLFSSTNLQGPSSPTSIFDKKPVDVQNITVNEEAPASTGGNIIYFPGCAPEEQ